MCRLDHPPHVIVSLTRILWRGSVRIWNWNKQKPLAILKYHTESVQAAAFAARGSNLLASASTNRIAVWAIY